MVEPRVRDLPLDGASGTLFVLRLRQTLGVQLRRHQVAVVLDDLIGWLRAVLGSEGIRYIQGLGVLQYQVVESLPYSQPQTPEAVVPRYCYPRVPQAACGLLVLPLAELLLRRLSSWSAPLQGALGFESSLQSGLCDQLVAPRARSHQTFLLGARLLRSWEVLSK